ncbi:cupin domain-containing protein [Terriglobus saanensis]|uniref:Cupin 2 conserved barrel domain protein n=1 Tax=Terriglobus saanensis (strain ATCC BAA-1853 / DSM 23119 / SP1PR4) TaxID=401053 RepID=E8V0H4_TERSS|nr:cupin domain-containing protein [Terriglobus saanensis]ADV84457.1 Cupin 2 conserved barrel domain protein [Terriglobus saanensis SP1PR4]
MHATEQRNTSLSSIPQTFDLFGVLIDFLVTPDETGHKISLFKGIIRSGVVVPLHSHPDPEVFYILEGALDVYQDSGPSKGWSTTQGGGAVAIAGDVKHALRNTSSTPVTAILATQEELYNFFRNLAKPFEPEQIPVPPSPEEMQRLFAAAAECHYWMGSPEENAAIGISL